MRRTRELERGLFVCVVATLLGLAVCSTGCDGDGDDDETVETGALMVRARDASGRSVEGVSISLEPTFASAFTDSSGAALFSGIAPGFYHVLASAEDGGVAADAAEVESGEVTRLTLTLHGTVVGAGGSFGSGGSGGSAAAAAGGHGGSLASGGSSGSSRAGGPSAGASGMGASGAASTLDFIDVGTQVEAMLTDPKRPYLYAVDRVNNAFLFVNLKTRAVEKSIFVGSNPVDLDFGPSGDEVFVANFGSTQIAVVDLEQMEVGRSMFVDTSVGTWEGNPYRLAPIVNDLLVFTSQDQWQDLKLVNAINGGSIESFGTLSSPDLATNPERTRLYVGEAGGTLHRFDVQDTSLTEVDTTSDYGAGNVVPTPDGKYVFFGTQKILSSNLKSVLGHFSEAIHATNADGSLAIGSSSVFDGNDFSIRGLLPITTPVLAIASDYATVYLYDTGTSRIYLFDLSEL
jgi:hypothetical protein